MDNFNLHQETLKILTERQTTLCRTFSSTSLNDIDITYNSQINTACILKDAINTNINNLKDVFTPVNPLSDGSQGVTHTVGFKGSDPVAIIKYSLQIDNNDSLHEICVGLALNELRKKVLKNKNLILLLLKSIK